MRVRQICILFLATALPVATASAQMSGKSTGRYSTHTISEDMQEMDDGSAVVLSHYHQNTFADDTKHPIDNTSSSCVGLIKLNSNGAPTSANGACFSSDKDGDGASFWWRMTDGGTSSCPDLCGVWGYYAGDGKFEGIEGSGTWRRTTLFTDGSTGTWEGSYKIP